MQIAGWDPGGTTPPLPRDPWLAGRALHWSLPPRKQAGACGPCLSNQGPARIWLPLGWGLWGELMMQAPVLDWTPISFCVGVSEHLFCSPTCPLKIPQQLSQAGSRVPRQTPSPQQLWFPVNQGGGRLLGEGLG